MSESCTINDRFKELRIAMDMSQEQFGTPIGLTKSSVSNIEKAIRNVNDRVIMLLESKFNANPQWLRNGIGSMFLDRGDEFDDVARQLKLNSFQRRLLQIVYEMPIEQQRMIRDFALKLSIDEDLESDVESDAERTIRIVRAARADADAAEADEDANKRA